MLFKFFLRFYRMNSCVECKSEVPDERLLFDIKENCYLCKSCFVAELVGRAEKNRAESFLLNLNPMARSAAIKAANILFDKMKTGQKHEQYSKEQVGDKRDNAPKSPE